MTVQTAERRACVESEVRALCDARQLGEAATRAFRFYGPEIMSYFHAITGDEAEAAETFSLFILKLWQGLPAFRWGCSFRTWAYVVARNALTDHLRERGRRRREVPLPPHVAAMAARVRTETREYLRTEVKDRVVRLRQELDPDDQTLLILRVDRKLSWKEIACVLAGDEATPEQMTKLGATLRKRYERIKETLRQRLQEG